MLPVKLCVIFVSVLCAVQSARILGVFHMPAYSHFQLGDRIFRELAARGHEVTVITPFELKSPVKNLKHVVLDDFGELLQDMSKSMFVKGEMSIWTQIIFADIFGTYLTEAVLNHTKVQTLLKSDEQFDLVIHELFVNDAFSGFAHFYKAPSVLISTQGVSQWTNTIMGNSHNPSYIPGFSLGYTKGMNWYQRTLNTLLYAVNEVYKHLITIPNQNKLLQKYFPGSPNLNEIYFNASLMLLNSHVSTHSPLPLLPNMVEIGGYHVQSPRALPKDLQEYLDNAKEGAIYFSMGSNLKSKDMPEHKRNDILRALGKLKHKVLWKWEDDVLPGQPSNVKLAKWLPQQDILAHPNVKLFLTHGGLLSTIEAIYHGVPILGLPVYGDQEMNIANAHYDGYGLGISFSKVDEASLTSAFEEILNNPRYTKVVKEKSKLMHDQLEKPLDRAIYWIEYVLRHQGAPHLQTSALKLVWYQYMLLDVMAVVTLSAAVVLYILGKLVKVLCCKKAKHIQKDKKEN